MPTFTSPRNTTGNHAAGNHATRDAARNISTHEDDHAGRRREQFQLLQPWVTSGHHHHDSR
jgi:hypothetical protein